MSAAKYPNQNLAFFSVSEHEDEVKQEGTKSEMKQGKCILFDITHDK